MNALTLALIVLSAGWLFVRSWRRTRYSALKDAGHPQYFSAALASALLFVLAASLNHAFLAWCEPYKKFSLALVNLMPIKLASTDNSEQITMFAAIAALTVALAYFLPLLFNYPLRANPRLLRALAKRVGSYGILEHVAASALDMSIVLLVSMSNGKAYVGAPFKLSDLDTEIDKKWFALFPLLSGYRTDEGRLEINTSYQSVYTKIRDLQSGDAESVIREFCVVVPMSSVVSFQTFNLETYYSHFLQQHASDEEWWDGADRAWMSSSAGQAVPAATVTMVPPTNIPSSDDAGYAVAQSSWGAFQGLTPGERSSIWLYNGALFAFCATILSLSLFSPVVTTLLLLAAIGFFGAATNPSVYEQDPWG